MENEFKLRYTAIALVVIIGCCSCFYCARTITDKEQITITDTITIHNELSDWQLLQMALIEVESDYNSNAVSVAGARGVLQEMPSYVTETNRLIGTEWQPMDVHNDTIALDCFTAIQGAYNPECDIERAIFLHNPKAGAWYKQRVLRKMSEIRRRERIRTLIINY